MASGTAQQIDITGLTADSRAVRDGYLFAAVPGTQVDGRQFIADAVRQGARAVLAPKGTQLDAGLDAQLVEAEDVRSAFARMAASFYGRQPAFVAAVTGTNGKTSVATFARQIWTAAGQQAASVTRIVVVPTDCC